MLKYIHDGSINYQSTLVQDDEKGARKHSLTKQF